MPLTEVLDPATARFYDGYSSLMARENILAKHAHTAITKKMCTQLARAVFQCQASSCADCNPAIGIRCINTLSTDAADNPNESEHTVLRT